jgi:hypothetical protein
MTTTPVSTPSPEAFLAEPATDEDLEPDQEHEEQPSPYDWPEISTPSKADPLAVLLIDIAKSLHTLVERGADARKASGDAYLIQQLQTLNTNYEELEEQYQRSALERDALRDQVAEVLEVIAKSTSQLANKVRDVLAPPKTALEPDPAPEPGPVDGAPAHDADVEVWREYARQHLGDAAPDGIAGMNRSQIRTLLGIPQTQGGAS